MSLGNAPYRRPLRILVLGGTAEARTLAHDLVRAGHDVTTSLAGRTASPARLSGGVRIGGFGGVSGLTDYLAGAEIDALVDATHPYAARISAHAVAAAEAAPAPLLRLVRPPWPDRAAWQPVDSLAAAAAVLPAGSRVFLTIGRQELDPFFARKDCAMLVRLIEGRGDLPEGWETIRARGPFALDAERDLMASHRITHLVTKNSGAAAVVPKLDAAETLGVTVVMVSRPLVPSAPEVATIADVLDWVAVQAGAPKPSSVNPGPV